MRLRDTLPKTRILNFGAKVIVKVTSEKTKIKLSQAQLNRVTHQLKTTKTKQLRHRRQQNIKKNVCEQKKRSLEK